MHSSQLTPEEFSQLQALKNDPGQISAEHWQIISNLAPIMKNRKQKHKAFRLINNHFMEKQFNKHIIEIISDYLTEPCFVDPITKQRFQDPVLMSNLEYAPVVVDRRSADLRSQCVTQKLLLIYLCIERLSDGMLYLKEVKTEDKIVHQTPLQAPVELKQITPTLDQVESKQESLPIELEDQDEFLNDLLNRLRNYFFNRLSEQSLNLFQELELSLTEAQKKKEAYIDLFAVHDRVGPFIRMHNPDNERRRSLVWIFYYIKFFYMIVALENMTSSATPLLALLTTMINLYKELNAFRAYRRTHPFDKEILLIVAGMFFQLTKNVAVLNACKHFDNFEDQFFRIFLPFQRLGYDGLSPHVASHIIYREKYLNQKLPIPVTDFSAATLLAMSGMLLGEAISLTVAAKSIDLSDPYYLTFFVFELVSATLLIPRSLISCSQMVKETKNFFKNPHSLFKSGNDLEGFPEFKQHRISPCLTITNRISNIANVVLLFLVAYNSREYLLKNPLVFLSTMEMLFQLFVRSFSPNAIKEGTSFGLFQPAPELKQVVVQEAKVRI